MDVGAVVSAYGSSWNEPDEAARRMRALRRRVIEFDVHHWANTFLGALQMVTGTSG